MKHGDCVCRLCASVNLTELDAKVNLHLPHLNGSGMSAVSAFPKLVVCLDCGFARFYLSAKELHLLKVLV
jgi:hypothetical protein